MTKTWAGFGRAPQPKIETTSRWADSPEGLDFIAEGYRGHININIVRAIASYAADIFEASAAARFDFSAGAMTLDDVWERATQNGRYDDEVMLWHGRTLREIMAEAE